jgi:hypothetical protein
LRRHWRQTLCIARNAARAAFSAGPSTYLSRWAA